MRLTIIKRVRKIMVIVIGNEIKIIGHESLMMYEKTTLDNIVLERLIVREKLVVA